MQTIVAVYLGDDLDHLKIGGVILDQAFCERALRMLLEADEEASGPMPGDMGICRGIIEGINGAGEDSGGPAA